MANSPSTRHKAFSLLGNFSNKTACFLFSKRICCTPSNQYLLGVGLLRGRQVYRTLRRCRHSPQGAYNENVMGRGVKKLLRFLGVDTTPVVLGFWRTCAQKRIFLLCVCFLLLLPFLLLLHLISNKEKWRFLNPRIYLYAMDLIKEEKLKVFLFIKIHWRTVV